MTRFKEAAGKWLKTLTVKDYGGVDDLGSLTFDEAFQAGAEHGYETAVEDMTSLLGAWIQGTLEQVNSGDATMQDVYPELRKLEKIRESIRALKEKTK